MWYSSINALDYKWFLAAACEMHQPVITFFGGVLFSVRECAAAVQGLPVTNLR